MMSPDISIIIVNSNTRELTLRCLEQVRRETTKFTYELIVIDNNSTDGTASAIRLQAPGVTLIANDENLGFARAANRAAARARGRYLIFFDPRAEVRGSAIDRLMSFATCTAPAGIWGGRTLSGDGTGNSASCASRMTVWNLTCHALGLARLLPNSAFFNGEAMGGWHRDTPCPVDIVSSGFMLIEADLWRKLNGFDASFFMYGEDADLCLRAEKLGATPLITPAAEIVLDGNASPKHPTGDIAARLTARATLIRKHWPVGSHWLGRLLLQSAVANRWFAAALMHRLCPGARFEQRADIWRQVFASRKSWRGGYRTQRAPLTWAVAVPQSQSAATSDLKAG